MKVEKNIILPFKEVKTGEIFEYPADGGNRFYLKADFDIDCEENAVNIETGESIAFYSEDEVAVYPFAQLIL